MEDLYHWSNECQRTSAECWIGWLYVFSVNWVDISGVYNAKRPTRGIKFVFIFLFHHCKSTCMSRKCVRIYLYWLNPVWKNGIHEIELNVKATIGI